MKPPMAIKLSGDSHYGASLLWVPLFGSSQPCVWLKGKIKAQQNFKHKLLPQIFSEPHEILWAFWPPKTVCHKVVFVRASVHIYQGFRWVSLQIAMKRARN